MQEKTWQEKVGEKLPGKVRVQKSAKFGPGPNLVFGSLAASALAQVWPSNTAHTHSIPPFFVPLPYFLASLSSTMAALRLAWSIILANAVARD